MRIDPTKTWRMVEARLASEADPALKRNLETVLAHMKAEAVPDVEALMATMSAEPEYHAWGAPDPLYSPKGREGVRSFYTAFAASGAHRLEYDMDRLVVDQRCVVTEGTMRIAYPGSILRALGHEVDDPEALYLYETRMCVVWPLDERGLLIGEDSYVAGDGFEGIARRKLRPEDIAA